MKDQEGVRDCVGLSAVSKSYGLKRSPVRTMAALLGIRPFGHASDPMHLAVENVSFALSQGDSLGLIGTNGAGKSTLLQMVAGTLRPTSGEVHVSGRVVPMLELGAGFNPEFSGIENIYLNASVLGLKRAEVDARLDAILAFAAIGDAVQAPVKTLSSGMYLRLAFAVAAHVDADLLIIDEAFSVGDAVFAQKCARFLREFRGRGGSLLLVSHDMPAILSMCDRVLWLDRGRVRALGAPQKVVDDYLAYCYQLSGSGSVTAPEEAMAGDKPLRDTQSIEASPDSSLSVDLEEAPDIRHPKFEDCSLRNELRHVFTAPDGDGFGTGKAVLLDLAVVDSEGVSIAAGRLSGGTHVRLSITFRANDHLEGVIAGFLLRDRYGQVLFGDNTYLTFREQPPSMQRGDALTAVFEFRMPYLPPSSYSIAIGIASGTQAEHVQHCWVNEALVFQSMGSHVTHGLIGIPMRSIRLERTEV